LATKRENIHLQPKYHWPVRENIADFFSTCSGTVYQVQGFWGIFCKKPCTFDSRSFPVAVASQ
jgi:hypothetical protein